MYSYLAGVNKKKCVTGFTLPDDLFRFYRWGHFHKLFGNGDQIIVAQSAEEMELF
jgi:hypothetical protein